MPGSGVPTADAINLKIYNIFKNIKKILFVVHKIMHNFKIVFDFVKHFLKSNLYITWPYLMTTRQK